MHSAFRAFLWVTSLPCVALACSPVTADRILGSDLAVADPRLNALPPSVVVGYAPLPGVKRLFTVADVGRIARMHNIVLDDAHELCFEVPLHALSNSEMVMAMRRVLPDGTQLAITDWPKMGIPGGDILCPLSGLEPAEMNGAQIWRGFVQYSGTRRTSIWARVELRQSFHAVVATRDLVANTVLDPSSVRSENWTGRIQREPVARTASDVIGKVLGRAVKAGEPFPLAAVAAPPVIRRGETVRVEVRCGPARLALSAVAERDGRNGELIDLRNPSTGKSFRARVYGAGAVLDLEAGNML